MILGTGIDIIEVARIRASFEKFGERAVVQLARLLQTLLEIFDAFLEIVQLFAGSFRRVRFSGGELILQILVV